MIAFSTAPGMTASDEGLSGGPYATALAAGLVKPGQSDLYMFHKGSRRSQDERRSSAVDRRRNTTARAHSVRRQEQDRAARRSKDRVEYRKGHDRYCATRELHSPLPEVFLCGVGARSYRGPKEETRWRARLAEDPKLSGKTIRWLLDC